MFEVCTMDVFVCTSILCPDFLQSTEFYFWRLKVSLLVCNKYYRIYSSSEELKQYLHTPTTTEIIASGKQAHIYKYTTSTTQFIAAGKAGDPAVFIIWSRNNKIDTSSSNNKQLPPSPNLNYTKQTLSQDKTEHCYGWLWKWTFKAFLKYIAPCWALVTVLVSVYSNAADSYSITHLHPGSSFFTSHMLWSTQHAAIVWELLLQIHPLFQIHF